MAAFSKNLVAGPEDKGYPGVIRARIRTARKGGSVRVRPAALTPPGSGNGSPVCYSLPGFFLRTDIPDGTILLLGPAELYALDTLLCKCTITAIFVTIPAVLQHTIIKTCSKCRGTHCIGRCLGSLLLGKIYRVIMYAGKDTAGNRQGDHEQYEPGKW